MLTGAAGLSCWWNIVILFLITVCCMWDPPGLRTTIRDLHVCVCVYVQSVANQMNRPAPWKHLSNPLNRYLSIQTKDLFFPLITLQMSSNIDVNTTLWEKRKLLKHVRCARARMHNFIWDGKMQICCSSRDSIVCCYYILQSRHHAPIDKLTRQGIPQNQCPKTKPTALVNVYFSPVSMDKSINTSGWRKGEVMIKDSLTFYVLFGYFSFTRQCVW